MENKQELRKRLKRERDAIPDEVRTQKSILISERLLKKTWYADTQCLLVYAAIQSEVDLSVFCERAWKDGKELFFPKVFDHDMEFYRIDRWDQLRRGTFSVMEPDMESHPDLYVKQSGSIMLVPGVAFSADGYRIGYGGGYYDRYLAGNEELYTVGVCYTEQLTAAFEPEKHDCRMKEIVTEYDSEYQSSRRI